MADNSQDTASGTPVEVEFWYSGGKTAVGVIQEIVDSFNESQSQYHVSTVPQEDYDETYKKLQAGIDVYKRQNILTPYGPMTTDPLLAALTGSVLLALGIGMVFKAGATTGGVDIIVKLLRKRYRHLKTGFLFECTDLLIVACSGLVFRNINTILYALIAVLVSGAALDYVLYGGDEAKMIYIITEKPEEIGRRIMKELDVGITYLRGSGGWTGNEKQVILCVVRRVQGPQVEELVKTEDPAAFMIVTSACLLYTSRCV